MKKSISYLLAALFTLSCNNMTKQNIPADDEILLEWEFKGNPVAQRYYSSVFTLENRSSHSLGSSGWALYYNQSGRGVIQESVTGNVRIDHVNGDLVMITPLDGFKLDPGERVEISYNKPGRLTKVFEAPMGPYMVYTDSIQEEMIAIPVSNYTIKPFPALEQIYPDQARVPLPDATWVYLQNRYQELLDPESAGRIIPTPGQVSASGTVVTLGGNLMVHFDEGLEKEADYLSSMLEQVMGKAPAVMQSSMSHSNVIRLISEDMKASDKEAYSLTIHPESGVVITGGGPAGVFYGIQSLLALVPVTAWEQPEPELRMAGIQIQDAPAFGYRGMHLDIARNFIGPDAIKKLIRAMAFYKLNRLHLHLTDDEGWRLEIPSLPELTEIGGYRGHTADNRDRISPSYGSGPDPDPGSGHGSGFLAREAFIEILQFAADHHIEVVPEINFPGHARAAIYAMENRYDRLMEAGNEEEALKYRLIDTGDRSRYNSAQNFNDNVICVCQEGPYRFYETVVEDIVDMYNDAGLTISVIHTGGDEVPGGVWTDSPVCDRFLEDHPEIGDASDLQAYFGGRLFELLKQRNLVMAGWEEIAMKKDEQGRWIPNPDFAGKEMIPYVWNSQGRYLDLGYRLANAGYPVILCNVTNFYFDLAYNHHPDEPGQYWGGFVNTRRAFEFLPYDVIRSTMTDRYWRMIEREDAFEGLERLNPDAVQNIIGIQGELWSEMIKGGEMLEYYYMPKMIGLAERAWRGQETWGDIEDDRERMEAMNRAWNEFANVIGQFELPRLDYLFGGFNYRLPPPGAYISKGKLYANIDFPGLDIRYTTDGTEPDVDSPLYPGPVEVSGVVRLRSFDTRGRGSRISEVEPNE